MRVIFGVVLVAVLALPLVAQGSQKGSEMALAEKAKQVQTELQKFEYKAKVDIPAVDCIFVQDGKLVQGVYQSYLKDNPKALKAGAITKVSTVKMLERGVQIYMASDSFAIIGVSANPMETKDLAVKDLVEIAKKSISALLTTSTEDK
jgi:major membrane immunogen (membrane-anchored lipoprotein)